MDANIPQYNVSKNLKKLRIKEIKNCFNFIEMKKEGSDKKSKGQIFTPCFIVDIILDELKFFGKNILNKKIIEPSFGDGAFLLKIVSRLILEATNSNFSKNEIEELLNNSVFGVELDEYLYNSTKEKLNTILNKLGFKSLEWKNLHNQNFLEFNQNNFDFIVGNPPYVRIHNIDKKSKDLLNNFNFSKGTTDLYVVFMEKCLSMLNKNGKLGFITPNSYFKNSSQKMFREYIMKNNLIQSIIDFGSFPIFDAGTYVAISIFEKNKDDQKFVYKTFKNNKIEISNYFNSDEITEWNFNTKENIDFLKANSILKKVSDLATVQCALATNKDEIFVGKLKSSKFNDFEIEEELLKTVIKASTFNGTIDDNFKMLFPYVLVNGIYKPLEESVLKENFPKAYKYLTFHKEALEKRDIKPNQKWFEFGRSQGLLNINKEKLVLKHIFHEDKEFLECFIVPADVLVFSGIYITSENLPLIKSALQSKDFCSYSKIIGKDMSGGYKSINSNNIKSFGIDFSKSFHGLELIPQVNK